jgi:hypothetical protein
MLREGSPNESDENDPSTSKEANARLERAMNSLLNDVAFRKKENGSNGVVSSSEKKGEKNEESIQQPQQPPLSRKEVSF